MQASRQLGRSRQFSLWGDCCFRQKLVGIMSLPVLFRCVRSSWFPFALMVLRACAVRMIEGIVGPLYAVALPPRYQPVPLFQQ